MVPWVVGARHTVGANSIPSVAAATQGCRTAKLFCEWGVHARHDVARGRRHQPAVSTSVTMPHATGASVTGTPTRAYSPNPIRTPRVSAFSATIRFAIEPMRSRLPANVELMATRRHTRSVRGRLGMTLRHSMTAGTLDTRLESTTMTALSVVARLQSEPHARPRPCA